MKNNLLFSAIFLPIVCFAQVGINTPNPSATLDVNAKEGTGASAGVEGLLIPRVDRLRAQSMTNIPVSTLVYVNSITTGAQTGIAARINDTGYYYFDGTLWSKLADSFDLGPNNSAINIYSNDGDLQDNRTVYHNGHTLTFEADLINAFSVDGSTLSVDAANNRVGVGTGTPQRPLHVNGSLQVTNELNVGGTASTAGNSGTSGQVLVSNGSNVAPSWQDAAAVNGNIANVYYVQGTTALTVNAGATSDVPGTNISLTVPAGSTQTFIFTILGYAVSTTTAAGVATQGVFSLLQDGVKISSAYTSSGDGGSLKNLPAPVTFLKSVTLPAGTYQFKVQYSSWSGNQIVNYLPSSYAGYDGDLESMLTKMQIMVKNN